MRCACTVSVDAYTAEARDLGVCTAKQHNVFLADLSASFVTHIDESLAKIMVWTGPQTMDIHKYQNDMKQI